jgi:hypothetical protein
MEDHMMKKLHKLALSALMTVSLLGNVQPMFSIESFSAILTLDDAVLNQLSTNPAGIFDPKKLSSLKKGVLMLAWQAKCSLIENKEWLIFINRLEPIMAKCPDILFAVIKELSENILPKHEATIMNTLEHSELHEHHADTLLKFKEKLMNFFKAIKPQIANTQVNTPAKNSNLENIRALIKKCQYGLIEPLLTNLDHKKQLSPELKAVFNDLINDITMVIELKIAEHLSNQDIQIINDFIKSELYKKLVDQGYIKVLAPVFDSLDVSFKKRIAPVYEKLAGQPLPF